MLTYSWGQAVELLEPSVCRKAKIMLDAQSQQFQAGTEGWKISEEPFVFSSPWKADGVSGRLQQ